MGALHSKTLGMTGKQATQDIADKRMDNSALINAKGSQLAAGDSAPIWGRAALGSHQEPELFDSAALEGHLQVAVPHCFDIRAVDTWQVTADRLYREEKALPPNILSVTAVPLTRGFLARFSDLKDMLGKISSSGRVILSLLCCSRYTSPWFSSV